MADHKSDFTPGSMDIREQEKTFAGFMKYVQWGVIIIVALLVFLALARA
ncbi:aa3-type cytochrome c oxidase subunit IV [Paragemmobacter ruber]|uniref:Aa3-type cytochrome c oxidase subunit IV n=1 Tax=Paragemmobacter ruber TaxID=1985673 RepID=A0ABW9Y387_9RHOB|nr:aa3-type cytochrome c oxidase subunit IV [Rhodobacter ruber]NBE06991.1 aa3-type cytochrome c oxidase subunit IV [Rhodobacter ruber]